MIHSSNDRHNRLKNLEILIKKSFECFQICAGPELQNFRISNYMLSKIYGPPKEKIKLHFYCLQCTTPLLITSRQSFAKENSKELLCIRFL